VCACTQQLIGAVAKTDKLEGINQTTLAITIATRKDPTNPYLCKEQDGRGACHFETSLRSVEVCMNVYISNLHLSQQHAMLYTHCMRTSMLKCLLCSRLTAHTTLCSTIPTISNAVVHTKRRTAMLDCYADNTTRERSIAAITVQYTQH
jgi:hypothetical protein